MQSFENLGEFYLGKVVDLETMKSSEQYYLYKSKDLTTHAICVGMTGSGKTGLCIDLLEEAAIDGIPALVIDPKGDMGNLMLAFPDFLAENFEPWIDTVEASRQGLTTQEAAAQVAENWKNGLADSGIDGARVQKYLDSVELNIYTPGSNAGKQLSIIDVTDLPSDAILNDEEALNNYVSSTVSNILSLLKIDSDPLTSREHILLSYIFLDKYKKRESLGITELIQAIQNPGFDKLGALDLESFYPEKDRFRLAVQLNNLMASPSFASWLKGEALDVQNLLYTKEGKPKISIISINHLSDEDRMFIVTAILNKVISWTRAQAGTSSLRAILYMDEIFGYFPPVSNPSSKQALLTLLKQARAFGLAVVLATQNPVDLDYKGLSNIGSWFIGRLQTEQDKNRLLDGLQSVSNESGMNFDRNQLSELISALPKRTFLVNNVHESGPELFKTRWTMSYLAGPLTRESISRLSPADEVVTEQAAEILEGKVDLNTSPSQSVKEDESNENTNSLAPNAHLSSNSANNIRKKVPDNIDIYYQKTDEQEEVIYKPALLAHVDVSFVDKKHNISEVQNLSFVSELKDEVIAVDWSENLAEDSNIETVNAPVSSAKFLEMPDAAGKKTSYTQWEKDLKDLIYRDARLELFSYDASGLVSRPGESESEFTLRIEQSVRETRDKAVEDLKAKYEKKMQAAEEKIRKAEARLQREEDQAKQSKLSSWIDIGSTVLDSFLGRKKFGKTTMNKAARSARSVGRANQQAGDVHRAEADLETYQAELDKLEQELSAELESLSNKFKEAANNISKFKIAPTKGNINVKVLAVIMLPYAETANGLVPLF